MDALESGGVLAERTALAPNLSRSIALYGANLSERFGLEVEFWDAATMVGEIGVEASELDDDGGNGLDRVGVVTMDELELSTSGVEESREVPAELWREELRSVVEASTDSCDDDEVDRVDAVVSLEGPGIEARAESSILTN